VPVVLTQIDGFWSNKKKMTEQKFLLDEVQELAEAALLRVGTAPTAARLLARAVMAAERDGIRSHGLIYVRDLLRTRNVWKGGWAGDAGSTAPDGQRYCG